MRVLGAVRAALIAHYKVSGEIDVGGHTTCAKDHIGALQRRVRMHSTIAVVHGVTVWLVVRVHVPLLAIRAEKVRAHCAAPAVLVFRILSMVRTFDSDPTSGRKQPFTFIARSSLAL
jgi:hypothetical protein